MITSRNSAVHEALDRYKTLGPIRWLMVVLASELTGTIMKRVTGVPHEVLDWFRPSRLHARRGRDISIVITRGSKGHGLHDNTDANLRAVLVVQHHK